MGGFGRPPDDDSFVAFVAPLKLDFFVASIFKLEFYAHLVLGGVPHQYLPQK